MRSITLRTDLRDTSSHLDFGSLWHGTSAYGRTPNATKICCAPRSIPWRAARQRLSESRRRRDRAVESHGGGESIGVNAAASGEGEERGNGPTQPGGFQPHLTRTNTFNRSESCIVVREGGMSRSEAETASHRLPAGRAQRGNRRQREESSRAIEPRNNP